MAGLIPRNVVYVCRACKYRQSVLYSSLQVQSRTDAAMTRRQLPIPQRRAASTRASTPRPSRIPTGGNQSRPKPNQPHTLNMERVPAATDAAISEDVRGSSSNIRDQVNAICASSDHVEEVKLLEVMDEAYKFANILCFNQTTSPDEKPIDPEEEEEGEDKLLSELDESAPTSKSAASTPAANNTLTASYRERSSEALCDAIYTLLKDPKVIISTPILSVYVRIVCQLGAPEYLPEIFYLYANKPQPIAGSNPIQYRNPSPNSPKNAIPQELSDVALDTAILQRDLALAVAIIDTTVSTRAFRLNKFVKKASLPLAFVGTTPVAAYAAADWVSNWQESVDPQMAKAVTLMASLAYIGTLSTIGFVTVTTWNDHHERVRWTEGTPLRWRWSREEERLYFDRIAMAWGFQRRRRRGEEMGGLWEELREECGVRGLVLDKSDLLPGMQ